MAQATSLENLKYDAKHHTLSLTLNKKLYTYEVVYGTAYIFIDRCYVFLDADDDGNTIVRLKGKQPMGQEALEALAGEFANELLNQLLRVKIAKRNAKIREYIVARALFSNFREREIFETDFASETEFLDDPLGIATPWEEKFKTELSEGKSGRKKTGA